MKTISCDQCWGTGEIEVLADSSSVYNPNEGPRYATIPCDECGGYGDIEIPDEEDDEIK